MTACTSCGIDVTGKNFCPNCGTSTRTAAGYSAPAHLTCARCGRQNDLGVRFCNNCGNQFAPSAPAWQAGSSYPQASYPEVPYQQHPTNYSEHAPYQPPYGHQVSGVPSAPGQPQMVLCCSTCQAVSALGTSYCPNCHSSLAGVYPTPVHPPRHANEVHIHHHHGQPGYPGQHYGPQQGYPHRRRGDSGPLDGMGGALVAGAGGLVGGLILGEVVEEIFDGD